MNSNLSPRRSKNVLFGGISPPKSELGYPHLFLCRTSSQSTQIHLLYTMWPWCLRLVPTSKERRALLPFSLKRIFLRGPCKTPWDQGNRNMVTRRSDRCCC